jgi:superfamily II DNA/RNA helicase
MTFTSFSFDRRIVAGIESCGYVYPTPIQCQAIPPILDGHDVMGLAQTGTGKTAAFALPILQRLLNSRSQGRGPRVLVLAPTRELAQQIDKDFRSLSGRTSIRSGVVMGGVSMGPQIRALKSAQVIVACPGRLVALLKQGDANLKNIDTLVLDEADRMLDMGFMPDIKRVIAHLPAKRQNLLFSATMPKDILALARRILVNPKTVQVDRTAPVASVNHIFYRTRNEGKRALLHELLSRSDYQSMLIFTRTKHKAKALSRQLANSGYDSTFLQGNMSQNQRERALNGFRDGRFTIMVATDIAARGLDCDRITHVINFDMPDTVDTYTHRIGRTGRAGRTGNAISMVTSDDADQLRAIEKMMPITIEREDGSMETRGGAREAARKSGRPSGGQPARKNRRRRSGRSHGAAA